MSFFPAFVNLENKKILVVGGGKIAGDKISRLLDFTKDITVISPEIDKRVEELISLYSLKYKKRKYQKGDILGYFIVVVAANDIELQKEIFKESRKERVLINSVDKIEYCDFIFPSYIKRGDLSIAFSTSGASPSFSKYLKRAIEKILPKNIEDFIKELKKTRESMPKGIQRRKVLDQKAKEYIEKNLKG